MHGAHGRRVGPLHAIEGLKWTARAKRAAPGFIHLRCFVFCQAFSPMCQSTEQEHVRLSHDVKYIYSEYLMLAFMKFSLDLVGYADTSCSVLRKMYSNQND
jgi:hypothetical protein